MKCRILKVIALGLSVFAVLTLVIDNCAAVGNKEFTAQSGPATTQEKTVEQTFKNIKLLKGMPQSQLFPAMVFISSSLGVQCDHCHVNKGGRMDFAADDKAEKQTARSMIKLVLEINKTYARGNPEVSCYTCHRGRTSPQGFPTLPLPVPSPRVLSNSSSNSSVGPADSQQISPNGTRTVPSVDDVLNKYIRVIGGAEAIEKIRSCVIKGTTATSIDQPAGYEADQMEPDKGYQSFAVQSGLNERVVNASSGWLRNSDGVQELVGEQVADTRLLFPLFMNLRLREQYSHMRVSSIDTIDGRAVYVINATRPDGKDERLYFELESGLLVRRTSYTRTMIGIIPQQNDFEDYRDVEGVKFPFIVRTATIDARNPIIVRKFDEIRVNIPIDESKLKMPVVSKPVNR